MFFVLGLVGAAGTHRVVRPMLAVAAGEPCLREQKRRRVSGPFPSCRSEQAARKCSYRSDRVSDVHLWRLRGEAVAERDAGLGCAAGEPRLAADVVEVLAVAGDRHPGLQQPVVTAACENASGFWGRISGLLFLLPQRTGCSQVLLPQR